MRYSIIEETKRYEYLDLAKGLLIISVVLSHSPFDNAMFIYWFHMPAFFIISGMLAKEDIKIGDQFRKFFLPYISFSIVDLLFSYVGSYSVISLDNFINGLYKYIYSGKAVGGVFWFIPCLFLSKIIFNHLRKNFSTKWVVIIVSLLYVLAHVYAKKVVHFDIVDIPSYLKLPWDVDVLLISIPYYAIGYFFKRITNIIQSKYTFITTLIASVFFFYLDFRLEIYYYINLKFTKFTFPILDLVVPITITLCILSFSYLVADKRNFEIIKYIGKISLIIMYLHKPICGLISHYIDLNFIWFTIIGVVVPTLIYIEVISKSSICKMIFLGKKLIKVNTGVIKQYAK